MIRKLEQNTMDSKREKEEWVPYTLLALAIPVGIDSIYNRQWLLLLFLLFRKYR